MDQKFPSLEDIYDKRKNSFDLIRFILAVLVIYSHSYVLLLGEEKGTDPLVLSSNNQISAGSLAVNCFFIISGFLIMQSLSYSKSYHQYLFNRILRIFPAFIISLVIVGFGIGPLLTNSSHYFSMTTGSPYEFIFKNLTFNIFGYAWTVRDVFSNTPFPGSANGSMWTLKHEFSLYLVLPILSFFYITKFKYLMIIFTSFICLLGYLNIFNGFRLINLVGNKYWILSSNEYDSFIKLAPYFLMGSLMYLFKSNIVINNRFFYLAVILFILSIKTHFISYVMPFTLPYIIIFLSTKFNSSSFRRFGDFSYGMYIYAFPIQQLIVSFVGEKINIYLYFIISLLITFVTSVLSWHLIEKRALMLKKKFNSQITAKETKNHFV